MLGLPLMVHRPTSRSRPWLEEVDWFLYINLNSRPDRNQQMQQFLTEEMKIPKNKIKRIEAIATEPGYTGCTRSHLKALHWAMESKAKYICILEDDLQVVKKNIQCIDMVNQAWSYLNHDFDVLFLAMTPIKLYHLSKRLHRVYQALSMSAFIVHRRYYTTLESIYQQALREKKPHDLITQLHQPRHYWYGFYPPILRQRPGYSDIEKRNVDYGYLEVEGKMLS